MCYCLFSWSIQDRTKAFSNLFEYAFFARMHRHNPVPTNPLCCPDNDIYGPASRRLDNDLW